ncbi:MAG: hypothetical protein AAF591_03445, partial [Verrucomicrobiota bacterium]
MVFILHRRIRFGILVVFLLVVATGDSQSAEERQAPKVNVTPAGISTFWGEDLNLTTERFEIYPARTSALLYLIPERGAIFRSSLRELVVSRFVTDGGFDLMDPNYAVFLEDHYWEGAASIEIRAGKRVPVDTKHFEIEGSIHAVVGWQAERVSSAEVDWKEGMSIRVGEMEFVISKWVGSEFGEGGRLYFTSEVERPEVIRLYWTEESDEGLESTGKYHGRSGDTEWFVSSVDRKLGPGRLEVVRWKHVGEIDVPISVR